MNLTFSKDADSHGIKMALANGIKGCTVRVTDTNGRIMEGMVTSLNGEHLRILKDDEGTFDNVFVRTSYSAAIDYADIAEVMYL
jgi:hypothetical protein